VSPRDREDIANAGWLLVIIVVTLFSLLFLTMPGGPR
jgi:hypothetical protein